MFAIIYTSKHNEYTMYKMMFSINDINNGALKAVKSMPQKDSTSDGNSSFEMARTTFNKQNQSLPAIQKNKQIHNHVLSHSNPNQVSRTASDVVTTKSGKWFGNRDASQITANRRNKAVGQGTIVDTLTGKQPLSFTTYKDINTTRDALTRVRAGGAVAPKKKGANRNNAPSPTFAPAIPSTDFRGIKYPVLYH
uniref:Uncharacterized protein n=1 Tax=viral metagenome TaxID=1070528 RepID=A0A6C0AS30_9ZZZZ